MSDIFYKITKMVNEKRLKQKDICDSLGISHSHCSTLINGGTKPSNALIKLANIIYGNERPPHPEPIIEKTILMMEDMEEHTKESAYDCVQKEKLLEGLKKEKSNNQERKAGCARSCTRQNYGHKI